MELVWTHHKLHTTYGQLKSSQWIFNALGQTQREQCTYRHYKKFDHTMLDVKQFTYNLNLWQKMIGMSDHQDSRAFPGVISSKDRITIPWNWWQWCSHSQGTGFGIVQIKITASSSVLAFMMDSMENTICKGGTNKLIKARHISLSLLYTGVDVERFTRVSSKVNQLVVTAKRNSQQNLRGTFANERAFNLISFKRGKKTQFALKGRRLGYQD